MREGENGGQLQSGNPGNKGGGRPKNEIREMCRAGFEEALPRLIRIALGTECRKVVIAENAEGHAITADIPPSFKESVDAMRELGNRGVGKMLEVDVPRTPVVCSFLVHPDVAASLSAQEAERRAKEALS